MWRQAVNKPDQGGCRDLRLFIRLVHYHNMLYWRLPVATFFTMIFPLILLIVLVTVLGKTPELLLGMSTAKFYVPSMAVYGAVSVCYVYLSVSTAIQREAGVLKRLRGTPLAPSIFLTARMASAAGLATLTALLLVGYGYFVYDVKLIPDRLPSAAIALFTGILSFSMLGMALATMSGTGEDAQALSNATLLPLAFISDVFMLPIGLMPAWLSKVADFFPLKHFAVSFARAFDPRYTGHGFNWSGEPTEYIIFPHLTILLVWGTAGFLVAVFFFQWEPKNRSPFSWMRR